MYIKPISILIAEMCPVWVWYVEFSNRKNFSILVSMDLFIVFFLKKKQIHAWLVEKQWAKFQICKVNNK